MSPHPVPRRSVTGRADTERQDIPTTATPLLPATLEPSIPTDTDSTTEPVLYTAEQAGQNPARPPSRAHRGRRWRTGQPTPGNHW